MAGYATINKKKRGRKTERKEERKIERKKAVGMSHRSRRKEGHFYTKNVFLVETHPSNSIQTRTLGQQPNSVAPDSRTDVLRIGPRIGRFLCSPRGPARCHFLSGVKLVR